MRDLFFSEWRRFSRWALAFALGQMVLLFLVARASNPLDWSYEDQAVLLVLFMLEGFLLAMVQIGGYRKPSQWLWLIHRPLPMRRIFLAMLLAATALLACTLLLPVLIWLAATDAFSSRVVDLRHYVSVLHLLAFSVMAWLCGTLMLLSRSRFVLMALVLPLAFAVQMISVWWLFVPVLICLGWLLLITLHAFRADRAMPPERNLIMLATALPLQIGFLLIGFHVGKELIELVDFLRAPPQRDQIVLEGELPDIEREASVGMLLRGLSASKDDRAISWREQLPLMPVKTLWPLLDRFPVRHQFGNLASVWWDQQRGVEWQFSHDDMRFHGRDTRRDEEVGLWGQDGGAQVSTPRAYDGVPLIDLVATRWYGSDAQTQQQSTLLQLDAGEQFIARPEPALDRIWVLSNRALRALHPQPADASPLQPPLVDWSLPLPADVARLAQVDVAGLLDGWLVSLFYFDAYERFYAPWQQLLLVHPDGRVEVLVQRQAIDDVRILTGSGGSPLLPQEAWWLSPLLHAVAAHIDGLFDRGLTRPPQLEWWSETRQLYLPAGVLMLLSVVLAAWWLRTAAVNPARRRLWLSLCLLMGLPALLSLMCLESRAPRAPD